MKRVINFQEDDTTVQDLKFSDLAQSTSQIKERSFNKKQKFDNNNNGNKTNNKNNKNKPDRAHIKAKRKEMLDFRKQLPIYSGITI